jgi:hypothetical protein
MIHFKEVQQDRRCICIVHYTKLHSSSCFGIYMASCNVTDDRCFVEILIDYFDMCISGSAYTCQELKPLYILPYSKYD